MIFGGALFWHFNPEDRPAENRTILEARVDISTGLILLSSVNCVYINNDLDFGLRSSKQFPVIGWSYIDMSLLAKTTSSLIEKVKKDSLEKQIQDAIDLLQKNGIYIKQ